jgi:hypothetical protein
MSFPHPHKPNFNCLWRAGNTDADLFLLEIPFGVFRLGTLPCILSGIESARSRKRCVAMKKSAAVIALAFLLWTSCAAQAQRPMILAQGSTPEVCTEVYQPVCGTDENGNRRTYSNACFARLAKAKDVTPGECPKR